MQRNFLWISAQGLVVQILQAQYRLYFFFALAIRKLWDKFVVPLSKNFRALVIYSLCYPNTQHPLNFQDAFEFPFLKILNSITVVLKFVHQNSQKGLLKHRLLGPSVPDSLDLGWDPRICISNKFLGDTASGGLETTQRTTAESCLFKLPQILFGMRLDKN